MTLEQQIKKIESILSTLEENDLPLEKSLAEFEKGLAMIKNCQALLKEAEQKVQLLTSDQQLKDYKPDAAQ
jgi:exodeoxyribonuclease VII small subunit